MILHVDNPDDPFARVPKALLDDPSMSFKAKGLISFLLSKTSNWRPILSHMCKIGPDGMDSVRTAITEAVNAGYAKRIRIVQPVTKKMIRCEMFVSGSKERVKSLPDTIESNEGATFGFPTSGFSTSGKSNATKDRVVRKNEGTKEEGAIAPSATAGADRDGGASVPEDSEPPADEVAAYMAECESEDQGGGSEQADSAGPATSPLPDAKSGSVAPAEGQGTLPGADVEPDARAFPWREVCAIFKAYVPEVTMPDRGSRRDAGIKAFWRKHGKATGVFNLLAQRVAESDWLMARNGHDGCQGRPYSWGWIFAKDQRGEWRCDRIMAGDFDNDRMKFVLEKKAKAAGPVLTRVMLPGDRKWTEVNLEEKLPDGSARYRVVGEHVANGLPEVLDRKC